uniref:uncharacterized protein LOC120328465 n=1 Tax=Styela clava TaxID=7725 RepID=UPI00193AD474|nr:uncharacterized protein LOC120328465 [Styela clava]XP_039250893.1 uncharacterized protein LOC120328465 [Styela clava]XP_039250895.1 uncharacterized protein LOC120328465 [Styela clava]XP_039250896.1 uncharacterized protein LOC120328465 [Styela clava]XP_039250897.1 uncharacterized protein LOC120328465 [Styela clava]XP_039250898.1 uncharacterized protein LOC120328465 [Styela clava]XP_039250899.1 uncharacterized protein LOC120328465 [Styela clava]XP_039250900.1 uncharacterized protein LOC1203
MPSYTCEICLKRFSAKRYLSRHQKTIHIKRRYECHKCGRIFSRKDSLKRHNKMEETKTKTLNTEQTSSPKSVEPLNVRKQTLITSFTEPLNLSKTSRKAEQAKNQRMKKNFLMVPVSESLDLSVQQSESQCTEKNLNSSSLQLQTAAKKRENQKNKSSATEAQCVTTSTEKISRKRYSPTEKPKTKKRKRDNTFKSETIDEVCETLNPHVAAVYRRHWASIKTQFSTGNNTQDFYNFRLLNSGFENAADSFRAIFDGQTSSFKISYSFGYILKNSSIDTENQFRYFHPSPNEGAIIEPQIITSEREFLRFMDFVDTTMGLEWARCQKPTSSDKVESVTNICFFVNKTNFNLIGCPVSLPDFIKNSKFVLSLDKYYNIPYTDKLCMFRCLAILRDPSKNNFVKDTEVAAQRFAQFTGKDPSEGVSILDLDKIEDCFQVRVNVFSLLNSDTAIVIRRSQFTNSTDTLNVNLYQNHFSYITDIKGYAKNYRCETCQKLWHCLWKLNRHSSNCSLHQKEKFISGVYENQKTVFERLEDFNINIPLNQQYYPFRVTFDFECYFPITNEIKDTKCTKYLKEHVPLSVAINSNVPEFTDAKCFITEGDPEQLIFQMMEYIDDIQKQAYKLLFSEFEPYIIQINKKLQDLLQRERDFASRHSIISNPSPEKHCLNILKSMLIKFMKQIIILGYNSGKYDINVIKPYLIKFFKLQNSKIFSLKRGNKFMCLQTEKFRFLDIMNYLAPGYTYDKFLKAFLLNVSKGLFPYEYIDDLKKLEDKELPPHSAFFSNLKNKNITEAEYEQCKTVWRERNMKSLRDYLIYYNTQDVTPFLDAIAKQFDIYKSKTQIDMFKAPISVPGLTLQFMFRNLNTVFTVPNEQNSDIHRLIRSNLVGGPAQIFHRYHEAGVTKIRGDYNDESAQTCESVLGLDANALYLMAIGEKLPTGFPVRWKSDGNNRFKKSKTAPNISKACSWLDWVSYSQNIKIQHGLNGSEKRIGMRNLPVDGFSITPNFATIYQFHGCLFHGHNCHLGRSETYPGKSHEELQQNTALNTRYFQTLGYKVVIMRECDWNEITKTEPVKSFLKSRQPNLYKGYTLSTQQMINVIQKGKLFGLIECDIQVPDELKEYYAEMPPIFKNILVSQADIGEHMRQYAVDNKIMSQPRRSLIGSYIGNKILLATDLVRWYINHGIQITHIYQFIEYEPKECFAPFRDEVSAARREGDTSPEKAILADTYKLLGNSSYGKTLENVANYRTITYCDGKQARDLINDPSFVGATQLDDNLFEVNSRRKQISWKLPNQIGFVVYQNAKLRMLELKYDFFDKYFDRSDYQYLCMDTDSAYVAISNKNLETLVKPEMREEFYNNYHKWFPSKSCETHRNEFIFNKTNLLPFDDTRECCVKQFKFDKRTPGLFKVEFSGETFVGLCAKTYFCQGDNTFKFAAKGLQNIHQNITFNKMRNVLFSKNSAGGFNVNFKLYKNKMYTYKQYRNGMPYFYAKRKVHSDGISTSPLLI